jgi:hypothetical protein
MMPKVLRAALVELLDNQRRPAGYVYAMTEEILKSRIKRIHRMSGSAWSTVIDGSLEEVEVSGNLYKTLSAHINNSVWSPYGKAKGDLTIIS